jgi:hypothetical protein
MVVGKNRDWADGTMNYLSPISMRSALYIIL